VVAGSGVAGLTTALAIRSLAPGLSVLLVTKSRLKRGLDPLGPGRDRRGPGRRRLTGGAPSATLWPRGARAVRRGGRPSRALVTDGPGALRRLAAAGARFDLDDDGSVALAPGRAGNRRRRIAPRPAGTPPGAEVSRALLGRARGPGPRPGRPSGIDVIEHALVLDLLHDADGRAAGHHAAR